MASGHNFLLLFKVTQNNMDRRVRWNNMEPKSPYVEMTYAENVNGWNNEGLKSPQIEII